MPGSPIGRLQAASLLDAIAAVDADLRDVAEPDGRAALEAIIRAGPSTATVVAEMMATGRWASSSD
jgi:hypothetical protein